jgi:hypothetical protein
VPRRCRHSACCRSPSLDVSNLKLDASDLGAELLGHLLEEELDVGVHGTELVLLAVRVVDGV